MPTGSSAAKISIYLLLILIGYLTADFAILNVRDKMLPVPPPAGRPSLAGSSHLPERSNYDVVISKNIFNADGVIPNPYSPEGTTNKTRNPDPVPSQLPLQLMGTIVHINPAKSIATINLKGKNEMMPFKIDSVIPENLATVTKIERTKVTFINNVTQNLEYIEMKDDSKINFGAAGSPAGGKQTGEVYSVNENEFELKRDDVNRLTSNLPELLQQARAIPNLGPDGKPNGFRIMDIQPGSIYERLGIKQNDIISGVNGEKVDNPQKAMELYNALRTSSSINLEIERNGRRESLNYNIKQ